ncbi:MAG TPA: DUF1579 family protein [Candidatus Acidoferrales bacterium]|nr:DUF1579 family protein [Candidatus Acidoferrales bacterium]
MMLGRARILRAIAGVGAGFALGAALGMMVMNAGPAQASRPAEADRPTAAGKPALVAHGAANRGSSGAQARAGGQAMGHGGDAAKMDAQHAELAKMTGEFDRVVKFVGQTGATAQPSTGTSKFSPVLGGKFILEESHDVVFGRPVEGLRIYGYNDATKQFEMARMYTMSNAITLMKGASDDGGKTIDYAGEAMTGTGNIEMHATLRWMNDDEFSVTMSTASKDGKETPFQETDYTRKK